MTKQKWGDFQGKSTYSSVTFNPKKTCSCAKIPMMANHPASTCAIHNNPWSRNEVTLSVALFEPDELQGSTCIKSLICLFWPHIKSRDR